MSPRSLRRRLEPLLVAALALLGCERPAPQRSEPEPRAASNILSRDYAGSRACGACHQRQAQAWQRSAMHRMTRDAAHAEFHAPFAGETLTLGGDRAELYQQDGERRLRITKADGGETLFKATKVIGGRQREDFVGVELGAHGEPRGEEKILPVSYLIFERSLRYKGYSVLVRERPDLEPGQVWRQTCVFCHNTAPALLTLLDELYGAGAPSFQGSASNELPPAHDFRYTITDTAELGRALRDELGRMAVALPDGGPREQLAQAMRGARAQLHEQHLIELGIGCEACHGASRAHAQAPRAAKPSFALRSTFISVSDDQGQPLTPALEINRACARCHTVLFSRYPYTWEGGRRRQDPGGSPINSGEARDFLLGDCRTQLSCANCHDPHPDPERPAAATLSDAAGDGVCQSCHRELVERDALRAHTHHAPESAGSRCLNCHMPKKNLGLAYELTRYHRIGSPNAKERVERDRPLECALCHSARSVDQIVRTMERWWGKRYDRDALRRLYGRDLRIEPLRAALIGGLPHEQAVAAAAAAAAGRKDLLSLVAHVMTSEYPLVRYFARAATEKLSGAAPPIDVSLPAKSIAEQLAQWERQRVASE